jgi:predicted TIM-barrel fold metal-dependent hydrolase
MVIDCHSHIYPEKIAPRAVASIGEFYHLPMAGAGAPEDLLTRGRRGGIDRFIVFSAAISPGQVPRINDYIAGVCSAHPEFTGFGTLHRDMDNPAAEIDRIIALGLRGVKFHPDMQLFPIDDPVLMDIYALLEGRLRVIFHTGDYRFEYSHPARLARVLDAFPRLQTVATHFGGWSLFDLALEYLQDRPCFLDVSSSLPYLGLRRAAELIHIYGPDRFLFGSDYPIWDPGLCLQDFLRLDLRDQERELILSENPRRFLGEPFSISF